MAIVDNTDYNALIVEMQERAERINRAIIRTFQYIAEVLVREARMKGDYIDQTGNLRSSIGAIILLDGQIVSRSGFEVVMGGSSGANEGLTYAQEIAAAYPRGIALVVVAGKDYAAHVAARGRDVLSSAVLKAEDIVPRMMRQLNLN
ncbi:MAG: hypothetical protein D8H91_07825 [Alloprevotella sp.]|nr:MAG: hypothetical protein D8H91_07825 [Alloprevotella sp.]